MSKTRWEQFNSIVENESVDLKEKALLLILFRYINYEKKYADPSRATLKKLTGISDNRTLDKIFDSLINKGLLVRESGKGVRSKYFIKVGGENTLSGENTPSGEITPSVGGEFTPSVGGEFTPQKENKKKIKENIYNSIFDFWISKNIKKHRSLTNEMKKAIDKTIKDYSESEILEAISNYSVMYNDSAYQWCNYQWGLNEFLVRKDKDGIRQIGMFLNEGSKYLNYLSWKSKNKSNNDTSIDFDDERYII